MKNNIYHIGNWYIKVKVCDSNLKCINIITRISSEIFILYNMNYYVILKENLQVLHKLQSKHFQIAIDKLSVMNFQLVEIETYFPMMFLFCTDIEMLSIIKYI